MQTRRNQGLRESLVIAIAHENAWSNSQIDGVTYAGWRESGTVKEEIMNIKTNVNPVMRLANDQFDGMFCDDISPQMKTAVAMSDALFGGVVKTRKPSDTDKLDEAVALLRRVSELCGELKATLPSTFDEPMQENKDLLHDVLNNCAAVRMHYYLVANAPFEPCDCGGKCDSCVAARSDEHYDRKRDGAL